jgi:cyclophilin type peptidyl-prolyl cis-trans isomerase/CLD
VHYVISVLIEPQRPGTSISLPSGTPPLHFPIPHVRNSMAPSRVFMDFSVDNSPIGRFSLFHPSDFLPPKPLSQNDLRIVHRRRPQDIRKVRCTPPRPLFFLSFFFSFPDSLARSSFRALCTGEKGMSPLSDRPLYYKNSIIHRSIANFMIQGGGK